MDISDLEININFNGKGQIKVEKNAVIENKENISQIFIIRNVNMGIEENKIVDVERPVKGFVQEVNENFILEDKNTVGKVGHIEIILVNDFRLEEVIYFAFEDKVF